MVYLYLLNTLLILNIFPIYLFQTVYGRLTKPPDSGSAIMNEVFQKHWQLRFISVCINIKSFSLKTQHFCTICVTAGLVYEIQGWEFCLGILWKWFCLWTLGKIELFAYFVKAGIFGTFGNLECFMLELCKIGIFEIFVLKRRGNWNFLKN